jgi:hypothetical protein
LCTAIRIFGKACHREKCSFNRLQGSRKIAGVHYTTVYDWQRDLKSLGKKAFLAYKPYYPGRGVKVISAEKEDAVLDCWKNNP